MSSTHIVEKHPEWLYVVTDIEGKILKSNEAFRDFTVHIRPSRFSDIVSDKKDLDLMLDAVERSKDKLYEPIRFFCQTKQIDHTMHWGKWHVFSMGQKLHFCGTDRSDIGTLASHEAIASEKLIQYINHVLNHDIRQPLTSINGVVNMLVEQGTNEEMILLTQKDNFEILTMAKDMVENVDKSLTALIKKVGREIKP